MALISGIRAKQGTYPGLREQYDKLVLAWWYTKGKVLDVLKSFRSPVQSRLYSIAESNYSTIKDIVERSLSDARAIIDAQNAKLKEKGRPQIIINDINVYGMAALVIDSVYIPNLVANLGFFTPVSLSEVGEMMGPLYPERSKLGRCLARVLFRPDLLDAEFAFRFYGVAVDNKDPNVANISILLMLGKYVLPQEGVGHPVQGFPKYLYNTWLSDYWNKTVYSYSALDTSDPVEASLLHGPSPGQGAGSLDVNNVMMFPRPQGHPYITLPGQEPHIIDSVANKFIEIGKSAGGTPTPPTPPTQPTPQTQPTQPVNTGGSGSVVVPGGEINSGGPEIVINAPKVPQQPPTLQTGTVLIALGLILGGFVLYNYNPNIFKNLFKKE
jgi:hypothetical protein